MGGKKKKTLTDRQVETRKAHAAAAAKDRAARAAEQADRHIRNIQLVKTGLPTPWELACAERARRRLETGVRDPNRETANREAS